MDNLQRDVTSNDDNDSTGDDYDYKYPPRYYDEFHTALHHYSAPHHHGPGEYDILIHDHDQFPDHDHIVKLYDDNIGHNHEYGAAVHNHNDDYDDRTNHIGVDDFGTG